MHWPGGMREYINTSENYKTRYNVFVRLIDYCILLGMEK